MKATNYFKVVVSPGFIPESCLGAKHEVAWNASTPLTPQKIHPAQTPSMADTNNPTAGRELQPNRISFPRVREQQYSAWGRGPIWDIAPPNVWSK